MSACTVKPTRRRHHGTTVHFVDEVNEHAGPLGGKGIGESGATGVAAALANAVFATTGKRVREPPITPDALVEA